MSDTLLVIICIGPFIALHLVIVWLLLDLFIEQWTGSTPPLLKWLITNGHKL